jgi:hypothetical protein
MNMRVVVMALMGALLMASPALAIAPAEKRIAGYAATPLPGCHAPEVLGFVSSWFQSREDTYWNTGLRISGFDRIRQTGLRPWGKDFVPRRFCTARAHLSDGKRRQVNYFVRETIAPFGNSWEVIWCVVGLDRHRTYAPGCEQATPW